MQKVHPHEFARALWLENPEMSVAGPNSVHQRILVEYGKAVNTDILCRIRKEALKARQAAPVKIEVKDGVTPEVELAVEDGVTPEVELAVEEPEQPRKRARPPAGSTTKEAFRMRTQWAAQWLREHPAAGVGELVQACNQKFGLRMGWAVADRIHKQVRTGAPPPPEQVQESVATAVQLVLDAVPHLSYLEVVVGADGGVQIKHKLREIRVVEHEAPAIVLQKRKL